MRDTPTGTMTDFEFEEWFKAEWEKVTGELKEAMAEKKNEE